MSGETINFAVSVKAASSPFLVVDAEGNPLADGSNVTLPDLTVGTAVEDVLFSVSGGTSPYSFSIESGAVPDGTDLNSTVNSDNSETVTLEGTPTTVEDSEFSISVSDSAGASVKLGAKKKIS